MHILELEGMSVAGANSPPPSGGGGGGGNGGHS